MQLFNINQGLKWHLAVLCCLMSCLTSTAQTVKNLRTAFDQSKLLMLIHYDIEGLSYKKEVLVAPYCTVGDTSHPDMKSLSGDYGVQSRGGKNKLVVWDPFRDGFNNLQDIQIDLKTTVRDADIPSYLGLEWQGSNSAPFGFKVLQLSQLGFFAGFRVGNFAPDYNYTVSNEGKLNFRESGVYKIGTEKRLTGYAVTGGLLFQMSQNAYGYAGGGWGAEQLFWKYQAYNLNYALISSEWALNEHINRKGITVDIGAVFRFRRLLLDLGLSTIQFKSVQFTVGLGLSFLSKQNPRKNEK